MGAFTPLTLHSVHNLSLHGPLHTFFFLASLPSSDLFSKRLNLIEPTFCFIRAQEHGMAEEKHIILTYFTFIFCSQISVRPSELPGNFIPVFELIETPPLSDYIPHGLWPSSNFKHLSVSSI